MVIGKSKSYTERDFANYRLQDAKGNIWTTTEWDTVWVVGDVIK